MGEPDFICAICQRNVSMRWSHGGRPHDPIEPICRWCEREYGGKGAGLTAGSFRDRREVTRGLALAEALRCEANQQQWGPAHAAA